MFLTEALGKGAAVLLVSMLWGCTNPFLRRGSIEELPRGGSRGEASPGVETGRKRGPCGFKLPAAVAWFFGLWSRWQFFLPFAVNQAGSALYAVLLGEMELSLALPLVNSLTFVFTAVTGYLLGERVESIVKLTLGILLVLAGTALCTLAQSCSTLSTESPIASLCV